MNCHEVMEQLELYAAGGGELPTRVKIQGHLSQCTSCAQAYSEAYRFINWFDSKMKQVILPASLKRLRPIRYFWLPLSTAAALLLGIGLYFWLGRAEQPFHCTLANGVVEASVGSIVKRIDEHTFKLEKGQLHVRLRPSNKRRETVKVVTETATVEILDADADGVNFEVKIEEKGGKEMGTFRKMVAVVVLTGTVQITNVQGTLTATAGETVTVVQDQKPTKAQGQKPTKANGKIAFCDVNGQIHVANVDGSNDMRLTDAKKDRSACADPAWSPDGRRIAYTNYVRAADNVTTTNIEIWVMDANGKNRKQLTNTDSDRVQNTSPVWSPDGKRIAFVCQKNEARFTQVICVMDVDGKNIKEMTNMKMGVCNHPSWSPDGEKIAFESYRDSRTDIYVIDANGKNEQALTDGVAGGTSYQLAKWSPDGKKIAFVLMSGKEHRAIMVMDADGANQKQLTDKDGFNHLPVWSPDGKQILFQQGAFSGTLCVMDADGTHQKKLKIDKASDPSWQPISK